MELFYTMNIAHKSIHVFQGFLKVKFGGEKEPQTPTFCPSFIQSDTFLHQVILEALKCFSLEGSVCFYSPALEKKTD